jgi:hypothetical protein
MFGESMCFQDVQVKILLDPSVMAFKMLMLFTLVVAVAAALVDKALPEACHRTYDIIGT